MMGSASGRPCADITTRFCERRASTGGAARPVDDAQDLRHARQRTHGLQLARAGNRDARGGTLREERRGMIVLSRVIRMLMLAGFVSAACATAPKPAATAARTKDAAPDRIAEQRDAAPQGLQLESDDERWGIEAARARKRQKDEKAARDQAAAADTRIDIKAPAR